MAWIPNLLRLPLTAKRSTVGYDARDCSWRIFYGNEAVLWLRFASRDAALAHRGWRADW